MDNKETQYIRSCQRGELENFAGLYDLYVKKIYSFIYYRTHHTETAEDLTSLTFTKALEHIGSFKSSKGTFSSWLYQIARNTITDHYRQRRPTSDIEDAWDLSSDTDIERDVDLRAKLAQVNRYLQGLPAQQRDIVLMRVWDGLSHREIAEILGISEANSKVIYSRTLAKLNQAVGVAAVITFLMINNLG
ncbi:MAG: RNA polymerase sigma factor [Candidatus Saccharibacteria bacterium]